MRIRISGFSLVELMVAVAIASVLLAVAVPNVSGLIKTNRTQSQARELYSQLMYARSEAVSRGHWVTICSSSNGTACGGTWSNGWIICDEGASNTTHNGACDVGEPILRKYSDLGSNVLAVVDDSSPAVAKTFLSFDKNGQTIPANGMTFSVCDVDKNTKYARAVLKVGIGQIVNAPQDSATGIYQDVKNGDLTCP